MLSQNKLLSQTVELFFARHKRVPRSERSTNITMARRYRGRVAAGEQRGPPRKGQRGKGFFDTLKEISKNPLVKKLGKKTLTCSKTT